MPVGVDDGDRRRADESAGRAAVQVAPHVLSAGRGDATMLLHVERGRYYTLNETGSRIWSLICEGVPFDMIVERLRDEYAIDAARAETDAASLIGRLLSESLVVCAE